MLKKYNIAFVPTSIQHTIIKYAQYFSEIADEYCLSDRALPHVTLCQFHAEEDELVNLWHLICKAIHKYSIYLEFKDISCITRDHIIHWVSLLPDQRLLLSKMHQVIAPIVDVPVKDVYEPHMTLINTKNSGYQKKVNEFIKFYSPIADQFVLAIGDCDAVGQFTQIIYKVKFV